MGQSLHLALDRSFVKPPSHAVMFNLSFVLDQDVAYEANSKLEGCHTVSERFSIVDAPQLSFSACRKGSDGSSMDRWSPGSQTASAASVPSPVTPSNLETLSFHSQSCWPHTLGKDYWQSSFQEVNSDGIGANESLWMPSDESEILSDVMDNYGVSHNSMISTKVLPLRTQALYQSKPMLKRAAMSNTLPCSSSFGLDENGFEWAAYAPVASTPQTQCPTIKPSVAFCNDMLSSPTAVSNPATLLRVRGNLETLHNSPTLGACDARYVAHWDAGSSPACILDDYTLQSDSSSVAESDRTRPKSTRSQRLSSSKLLSRSKSGMDCEVYIRQNEHACTVPGCVDKTGKPKRFKRSEHRKRHERTVHGKDDPQAPRFMCWVKCGEKACGRTFSRNDNLKSHLFKTHGKKSPNQRNLYVATLDQHSKYRDFQWTGPLNKDGLPLNHPLWPEVRQ